MKIFNQDDSKAKLNERILKLERRLSEVLAINEGLTFQVKELTSKVKKLTNEIDELKAENKFLQDKNNQLEKRLKINSANSNMPSSTNLFNKKTVSSREKSTNKTGGQFGHEGNTIKFAAEPTHEQYYKPQICQSCGGELSEHKLIDTRQVHDIEIIKTITNHYIYQGICSCGQETLLNNIEEIPHGVSYGNYFKSVMLYLHNKDLIPTFRLASTAKEIFNMEISEGSIYNWQKDLSTHLMPYEYKLCERLLDQTTLHADESGLKVKDKNYWLHVISTADYTFYDVHPKRGMEAMEATGVLTEYEGNLMHDCFKAYHQLPHIKQHGLCNAHLLRELKSISQFYKLSFAEKLRELLMEMNDKVKLKQLTYQMKLAYKASFNKLIDLAKKEAIKLNNEKWRKDVQALAKRLEEHGAKYLAFLDNSDIPFTNNQAERDIRMIKTKQKISGRFKTEENAKHFAKIRGFISTMQKHGKNVIESLFKILQDDTNFDLDLVDASG